MKEVGFQKCTWIDLIIIVLLVFLSKYIFMYFGNFVVNHIWPEWYSSKWYYVRGYLLFTSITIWFYLPPILYCALKFGFFNKKDFIIDKKSLKSLFLFCLISFIILFILTLRNQHNQFTNPIEFYGLKFPHLNYIIYFIFMVILGPIFEEILFRGYLFELILKKIVLLSLSICLSSFFNMLLHLPHRSMEELVIIFLVMCYLNFVYIKTKITGSIITHSIINIYLFT